MGNGKEHGGKLKWAGQAWANGTLHAQTQPDDDLIAEAMLLGVDPEGVVAAAKQSSTGAVWPQNVAAVTAFLTVQSQMKFSEGMQQRRALGLDYSGVRAGLKMAGIKVTPALWNDVQTIEFSACNAINGMNP